MGRIVIMSIGFGLGVCLLQSAATAEMSVSLHGDFGDSGSMNVDPPSAVDITMQTLEHTHEFAHASYSVKGQGLGSTISSTSNTGPAMYAYASTKGGDLGAVGESDVTWTDIVRLDDGGDPNVLESASQMAGLSLGLELYIQSSVQKAASDDSWFSYDLGLGSLYGFQDLIRTSDEVHRVLGPYAISEHQNDLESGLTLRLTFTARSFTNPHETTSVEAGIEIESFRFVLTDAQGNLVPYDAVPAGLHVASVTDPNRWYPLLPDPGTSAFGDYNRDGKVDAADYVFWRDHFGDSVVPGTGADGNGDGHIDVHDFDTWRGNFGPTAATGSTVAVPEPRTWLPCVTAVLMFALLSRGWHRLRWIDLCQPLG